MTFLLVRQNPGLLNEDESDFWALLPDCMATEAVGPELLLTREESASFEHRRPERPIELYHFARSLLDGLAPPASTGQGPRP
jgi:hypothetical protein